MKGYELIKKIEDGYIDDCKIEWQNGGDKGIIEVRNRGLSWEPGTFSTHILTSSFANFDVIKEKEIQRLNLEGKLTGDKINAIERKINEIIIEVNLLNGIFPF